MDKKSLFELTYKELKVNHIELWDWLSKNPNKEKVDWPGWDKFREFYIPACFACVASEKSKIYYCPIRWIEEEAGLCQNSCMDEQALYMKWEHDSSERCKTARKIRDLPWYYPSGGLIK